MSVVDFYLFIPWLSDRVYGVASVFLFLFRLGLCLSMCSVSEYVFSFGGSSMTCREEGIVLLCLGEMFGKYLLGPFCLYVFAPVVLRFCLNVLFIDESEILKSITVIVEVWVCLCLGHRCKELKCPLIGF